MLLEHGANPNIASKFTGETPIFYALVTIMRLEKGLDHVPDVGAAVDTPSSSKTGESKRQQMPETRSLQDRLKDGMAVVQLLAGHGARLDVQNKSGKTPMQLALEWDCWDDIEALHSVGVRIPDSRPGPRTLAEATDSDDLVGVKQLIKKGANPNTADKNRIHSADDGCATRRDLAVVAFLLDHGAKPDFRVPDNGYLPETPLFLAAGGGRDAVVRLLLKRGANPKLPMGGGNSPLGDVAREGHIESLRILLDAGVDVNACEKTGVTALMSAVIMFGRSNVAKLLLERGAHVTGKFVQGVTPLMRAAEAGSSDIVALLIKAGSDVKARSASGETVLQWAVLSGDLKTVRMILDVLTRENASINERNEDKKTALSLALDNHHDEIVELLKRAGATE